MINRKAIEDWQEIHLNVFNAEEINDIYEKYTDLECSVPRNASGWFKLTFISDDLLYLEQLDPAIYKGG